MNCVKVKGFFFMVETFVGGKSFLFHV